MKIGIWASIIFGILLGAYQFIERAQKRTVAGEILDLVYYITEAGEPDSFDPINADKTHNITSMRMLYATPLEVNEKNEMVSQVLSSFAYHSHSNQIEMTVRSGLKFANGEELTANDVAMSIARIAYFKKEFPVIKSIKGLEEWHKKSNGLRSYPSGIQLDGQKILISLDRKMPNPLFRFCLELFSIIPTKDIDLETGLLKNPFPSASGFFELEHRDKGSMRFKKRGLESPLSKTIHFNTITFKYGNLSEICAKELLPNEVISAIEIDFLRSGCSNLVRESQIHTMPSSRFGVLRFNPTNKLFASSENRQLFAEAVRDILRKKNLGLTVERGLLPILIPGYLKSEDISIPSSNLRSHFKDVSIRLPSIKSSGLSLVYEAIIEAAKSLEMKVTLDSEPSADQTLSSFLNGDYPVVAGASGFWAQDPVGDISMWFTKNLHKTMTFAWQDGEIYKQIGAMEFEEDGAILQKKLQSFNLYISQQSVLQPVLHFKRIFIGSVDAKLNLPQAITSPAPWHVLLSQ